MIRHLLALANPRFVFRDAVTGQFVTRLYALAHPSTTVRERRRADIRPPTGDVR